MMRHMRWSYADLVSCPRDYIPVIIEEAASESRRAAQRPRHR
jgi:hypothetical protein